MVRLTVYIPVLWVTTALTLAHQSLTALAAASYRTALSGEAVASASLDA